MNGYEFKREIERIFKVAREMYPNITDDMLDTNGAIHYMNGNDGTSFDWNANDRLCEFYVYHKNEMGFIKAFVNRDNTIDMYIYEDGGMKPTYKFTEEMENLSAKSFANLMDTIADREYKYDRPIDELDWDVDTMECYDINDYEDEYEEDDWY